MSSKAFENVYVAVVATIGAAIAISMDYAGMPQKWHAAVVGTVVTFGGVAFCFRRRWESSSFWFVLATCFVVHIGVIWLVFEKVFAPFRHVGILVWAPVAFAEGILLLGVIPLLGKKSPHRRNAQ